LAFVLWDIRNILIFRRLHQVAWDVCEKAVLLGRTDGVHGGGITIIDQGFGKKVVLEESRNDVQVRLGFLRNLGSHTVAIFLMIAMAIAVWITIIATGLQVK
jgi:hypothetical protein